MVIAIKEKGYLQKKIKSQTEITEKSGVTDILFVMHCVSQLISKFRFGSWHCLNFKRCELFSVRKEDFQGFMYFFSKKPLPFSFICSIFDSFYLTLCRVLSETLEQWGAVKLLHGYFSLSLKLDITVNSVLVHSPLEGHQFLTTLIFHTLKMKHLIAKETSLWTSAAQSCCIHRKPDIHSSSKRSVNYPHFTLSTTGNSKSKFKIRLCKCFLGSGEGGQEEGVLQFQTNMD